MVGFFLGFFFFFFFLRVPLSVGLFEGAARRKPTNSGAPCKTRIRAKRPILVQVAGEEVAHLVKLRIPGDRHILP